MEGQKREGVEAEGKNMVGEKLREILPEATSRIRQAGDGAIARLGMVSERIVSVGKGLSRVERLVLLFAVGIVIGYGVKLSTRESVTVGYDDYTLAGSERAYDLLAMERELSASEEAAMSDSGADAEAEGEALPVDTGATCQ